MNTKELLKLVASCKTSRKNQNKLFNEVAKTLVVEFPNCGFDKTAIVEFINILTQEEKVAFVKWFEFVSNNKITYSVKNKTFKIALQEGCISFNCLSLEEMPDFIGFETEPVENSAKPAKTKAQLIASFEKACSKIKEQITINEFIQACNISFTELENYYLRMKEVVDNIATSKEQEQE